MEIDVTQVAVVSITTIGVIASAYFGSKQLTKHVKKETKKDVELTQVNLQLQIQEQLAAHALSQAAEVKRMDEVVLEVRRQHHECEVSLHEEKSARLELESRVQRLESNAN